MGDSQIGDGQQLAWEDRKLLDELCDRFEAAWLTGDRPDLSDFVHEAEGSGELFRELLALDVEYRRKAGDHPGAEDYTPRFPDRSAVIAEVFSGKPRTARETSVDGRHSATTVVDTLDAVPEELGLELNDEFELMEALGRGGMGIVFKARHRAMQRLVAIKVPRPGRFASDEERERFEREVRVVARLDHPGIVRVHDVGRTSTCTYMVSEFVAGRTLAETLTERAFSNKESAQLIKAIAESLEHAHQRGVVHRDLKSSNIMLADGSPLQPRLMDFGLALKHDDDATVTQTGDVLGTPAYMSPEQARGDAHQVDGRSDIYSLGVMLYELLAGERPFRGTSRQLIRQVLEDDPRPPRQLDDTIPLDLETIALKCLAKEPGYRYQSASEVADELDRHLSGEAILARPVSIWRRRWNWCRRNPMVASLSAVSISSLLAVATISTVSYVQTSRAQQQAEQFFLMGNQAIEDLFTTVSEDTLLNQPGMQPLRRTLLYRAREYYEQFLAHRANVPELQAEMALAQFRVGLIDERLQSPKQALAAYLQARDAQGRLLADSPGDVSRMTDLSDTLTAIGRCSHKSKDFVAAHAAYTEAFRLRESIAQQSPKSLESQRKLASIMMNRGLLAKDTGDFNTARSLMQRAQTLRFEIESEGEGSKPVQRDLAMGYYNLALVDHAQLGQAGSTDPVDIVVQFATDAETNFREAIARFSALMSSDPADLLMRQRLAICERLLADLLCLGGRREEAAGLYATAFDRMTALVQANPSVVEFRIELGRTRISQAQNLLDQSQLQAALGLFSEAVAHLERVLIEHPDVVEVRPDYVVTRQMMVAVLLEVGRRDEAVAELKSLRKRLLEMSRQSTDDSELLTQLDQTEKALQQLRSIPDVQSGH